MKRSKALSMLIGFVFVLVLAGIAQQKAEETVTCPVSGEVVKKSEAKASYDYKGKTYYFCCNDCKEKFMKDPEKYIQKTTSEEKTAGCCSGKEAAFDLACGTKVKKSEAKVSYEYKGKTYYFCSEQCKEKFVKDPEKYIKEGEEQVTCPVTGEVVKKSEARASYEYKGKTYYFCCEDCKEKFIKDPENYIQKKDEIKAEKKVGCSMKENKKN